MKTTILKDKFSQGLGIVERIAGRNLSLPILGNVLISAQDNTVQLSTTDLEVGINHWLMAKVEEKGKITVPVRTLFSYASLITEEKINIETKDSSLILKGKNYKTQIKGLDAKDFPIIPEVSEEIWVEAEAAPFAQAILQVIDFCALSQTRLELSGIYLLLEPNQAKIVSTDSFRLAEKTIPLSAVSDNFTPQSFILPRNGARELINIFSKSSDKFKLYLSPNQIMAEKMFSETNKPQVRLVARLIEGEYPNYQEVIPQEIKTELRIACQDLSNQIKKASLFSGKSNELKLKIEPEKKEVVISSQNVDLGETKSKLEAELSGEPLEINFNCKFLQEGITQIASQELIMEFSGADGPALIKPVGESDFLYVIMPIKSS